MGSKRVIWLTAIGLLGVGFVACEQARYETSPSTPNTRWKLVQRHPDAAPPHVMEAFRQAHPVAKPSLIYERSYEKGLGSLGSGWVHNGWTLEFTEDGRTTRWDWPVSATPSEASTATTQAKAR